MTGDQAVLIPEGAMRRVERSDILDGATYEDRRGTLRAMAMEVKRRRRVHLGRYLTFLFENRTTIWYQIQEMLRVERIVDEAAVQHEIDTYNALLGGPGELGCSLLIEIEGEEERSRRLREWRRLPGHVYLRCEGDVLVRAEFDPAQSNDRQLSSVQYLRFQVGELRPIAVGCELPALAGEAVLNEEQREAINRDLASPGAGPRRSNL
ncbi:MAG TPA: DUF3501 family protein [Polyangia bacterium]|nr:DUF3501 family protein [Polyangia bacterium]